MNYNLNVFLARFLCTRSHIQNPIVALLPRAMDCRKDLGIPSSAGTVMRMIWKLLRHLSELLKPRGKLKKINMSHGNSWLRGTSCGRTGKAIWLTESNVKALVKAEAIKAVSTRCMLFWQCQQLVSSFDGCSTLSWCILFSFKINKIYLSKLDGELEHLVIGVCNILEQ